MELVRDGHDFVFISKMCAGAFPQDHTSLQKNIVLARVNAKIKPLGKPCKIVQGPELAENLADDLVFRNAADHTAAAVDGGFSVVTHHKIGIFGNLIGKLNITFAQCFFGDIRLNEFFTVQVYGTVAFYPQVITGYRDDALD